MQGAGGFHRFGQVFLCIHLDGGVDGGHQTVAIHRIHHLGVFHGGGHLVTDTVLGGDDTSRRAGQHRLILGLQALQTVVIRTGEAQYGGGHSALRIIPLVIGDDVKSIVQTVILRPRGKLGLFVIFHLRFNDLVLGVGLTGLLVQSLLFQVKHLCQILGNAAANQLESLFIGQVAIFIHAL